MLIAQLTDIHIGFEQNAGGEELNDLRLRITIERLLDQPNVPDMLMLTGDLTDRGDAASFARITGTLGACPFPVYPLVGNHDSREALLRAFPDCPNEDGFVHYAIEIAGLRILCLDTFEPGRHGGAFCARRAAWLAGQLSAHRHTPTLIFMHHPPVVSGIDWMDPRADEDWIVNFGEAIAGHSQIKAIHCGHLHRPLQTSFRGIALGVSPSVAPAVSLDLRPVDAAVPDGRALITTEPPGYALHRWHGGTLATHYETVGDWQTLARYGPQLQPMMRDMFAERE
ncbi:MAG: phosphodiesterase [Erythrobacter sp.]|nr:phosphodiesterase [Erythrobacter sp.]